MDIEKVYQDLTKILAKAGGAIPVIANKEFDALIKDLVTPEEAAVAVNLSDNAMTAEEVAHMMNEPLDDVLPKLESMANGGFLHSKKIDEGAYRYAIMPLLPGIFEGQFYRGTKNERDYLIARRFKDYLEIIRNLRDSMADSLPPPKTSYFRVLPVGEEVAVKKDVLPFAQLEKYVEKTQGITVGTCFCRHHAVLIDAENDCGVSHQNCMAFGEMADYAAERMNGRRVSKKEALEILKQAETEGLVHCSANTSEELMFICNCCSCHCGILRMAKSAPSASAMLTSGYYADVDENLCTACETCIERCPVSAISVEETAIVDRSQCIGCGLCVSTCPTEAITLFAKAEVKTPPARMRDLEEAMKSN